MYQDTYNYGIKNEGILNDQIKPFCMQFETRTIHEKEKEMSRYNSPVESLLDEQDDVLWPKEIQYHADVREQAELRHEVYDTFESVFRKVPDPTMDLSKALAIGLISEEEVSRLYSSVCRLLEQDTENNRMLLYLPFELLPNDKQEPKTEQLRDAIAGIKSRYRKEWFHLLSHHDIRADFSDGDIMEANLRTYPLPKVVKAAHLIPWLVERDIISVDEVITIMEKTNDGVLRESIADSLQVLAETNALSHQDIYRMTNSHNSWVANLVKLLNVPQKKENAESLNSHSLEYIRAFVEKEWQKKQHEILDEPVLTKARRGWLMETQLQKIVASGVQQLQKGLDAKVTTYEDIVWLLQNKNSELDILLGIEALRASIDTVVAENFQQTKNMYEKSASAVKLLWQETDSLPIRKYLERYFLHAASSGITSSESLKTMGFEAPTMLQQQTKTRESLQEKQKIQDILYAIENNPFLKQSLYPIVLLIGSRSKGYAANSADFDTALFVRATTSISEMNALRTQLSQAYQQIGINGEPMEFWIQQKENSFSIRDFSNPDASLGDSTLTHPLLGSWHGNASSARELFDKLMPRYLISGNEKLEGESMRTIWLRDMEHTILQYRLMHKGYERYYRKQGGKDPEKTREIDGDSAFYDSGYRRMATQLFLSRIFLPQITPTKEEK